MHRSLYAYDPATGVELASLSATIQPHLAQLSDDDVIKEGRRELVRLHSLTQSQADGARYEVRED